MVGTMGAKSAGIGPEAGVYEALAAAVANPKEFAKRLKALAAETAKHGQARDQAIREQNLAIGERKKADKALGALETASKALSERGALLKGAETDFKNRVKTWEKAKDEWDADIERRSKAVQEADKRLVDRESEVKKAESLAVKALLDADAAKAEWTAKRDKLNAAMK